MCDKLSLNLQKALHSLETRVPKIILQRVEEIFPYLKETVVSVYPCMYKN
jgi:hypothetical protein